jgi:TRAP-type transport system periplasmic protein
MRIARRTFLASTAAVVTAPAVMRFARADAPQVALKLHHFMSSVSSAHDKFIVPWVRKVQADSNGRIRIDIFPSMQLGGTPAHLFDQARDGDADIVWTAPSLTPGRFPRIEMFDLPFVPSRRALVSSKALQDFAAVNLKDEFREIHPICFSCTDRGVMHANQPIRTIEDIRDLKIHVQTRFAGEAMRVLGAQPVPMPLGQLPLAVNQHIIDGCVDPWHMMPALRLNDLLKTHTEFSDSSPSSTTFVLAMNGAAYDRLPRDLKAVIDNNSGQAAAGMAGAMWDIEAAGVADTAVRGGDSIVTLLPEAVAHWRKTTDPVVEKWLKEMKEQKADGGKLLASMHTLLVKYADEPEPQPPQPPVPQQQDASQPPQQTVSPPQQQPVLQQQPQTGLTTTPKINASAPSAPAPSITSSAAPSGGPVTKSVPPQPPAPRMATPAPSPAPAPATATIAKPVPPTAPHVAAPAPTPVPAPPAIAPVPSTTASVMPAAKPAAAPVLAPTPAPAPVPSTASIVPATKPAAAPVLAPTPAHAPPAASVAPAAKPAAAPALAPTPAPPPTVAAAPPPPALTPTPVPKPVPKTLDIPL